MPRRDNPMASWIRPSAGAAERETQIVVRAIFKGGRSL